MNDLAPVAIAARQQSRAADPTKSVWVSASAGTGKTKVLTDRVLALMLNDTPPQRILCLTFTKAAAAEMANRIAEELSQWVTLDEDSLASKLSPLLNRAPTSDDLTTARRLFARVLDTPGGMNIQTIHAFCQSVLRRFPLEAGLAPHFDLLSDQDTLTVLDAAEEAVIARAHHGGDETLADAFGALVARVHEYLFPDLLAQITAARDKLERVLSAHGGVGDASIAVRSVLGVGESETAETVLKDACDKEAFDRDGLKRAAEALASGSKTDKERGAVIAGWLELDRNGRIESFADYTRAFLTNTGTVRATLATKKTIEAHTEVFETLSGEADRILEVNERMRAVEVATATHALLVLSHAFLEEYQARKAAFARLDYDDLIQHTRTLLNRPGVAEWVLFKLDGGLDHLLIDEAQDTSPDQWAVVQALTEEFFAGLGRHEESADLNRTMFAVGDRKQSIYSFQGAAPEGFDRLRSYFHDRVTEAARKWADVDLGVSFRSTAAVLQAVDAVFAGEAAKDGVVTDDGVLTHLAARQGQAGLVEVWPPVDPDPADDPAPWKPPVERIRGVSAQTRLARLIAQRIARMCDGERLASKNRVIAPGDIMVLVRRRTGFVDDLVRALKDLNIPVAGVDRMVLIEQMAVMDLVAIGRFLLLPQDDLTLATVLKSPLIGLSEEELFDLAHRRGNQTVWAAVSDHAGSDTAFGEAYDILADLLNEADYRTPFSLYAHLLTFHDGRRKVLGRLGMDADDPIDEFLAQALEYERLHTPSLEGFLHWLERGRLEVKRDLEQSSRNAVRVMTVHGAKGLQAPIVFLPDTLQTPGQSDPLLWTTDDTGRPVMMWAPRAADRDSVTAAIKKDADAARDREYRRLLYVAMTRAEDRLYICGWNTARTAPSGCWYNMIRDALAPLADPVDEPLLIDMVRDGNTVLRLAEDQSAESEPPQPPEYDVPIVDAVPEFAEIPAPPEPAPPRPLAPSRPKQDEPPVISPTAPDPSNRFQRGLLIHRLLQSLPDLAAGQRHAAAVSFLSRPSLGLGPSDIEALTDETLAVLNHDSFAPLFGPGSKAEVAITGLVGGRTLSGQVDRLVVTESEVMIIDYKTNRPPPQDSEAVSPAYLFQMASYRAALREIYPDHTIRCVLLWTTGPFVMELPDDLLDTAWRKHDE